MLEPKVAESVPRDAPTHDRIAKGSDKKAAFEKFEAKDGEWSRGNEPESASSE